MSNNEQTTHSVAAQALVEDIRALRQKIPNLTFPSAKGDGRKLTSAATVPAQFVELTAVAVTNNAVLVRPESLDAVGLRDLLAFADAYGPVADELEMLAHFLRHSVASARNKAGSVALTTYSLAGRLAKRPETAYLAPLVEAMSRALGRRRRPKGATDPVPPQGS